MVLSAALFDMDGTLTDSEILWFEAERPFLHGTGSHGTTAIRTI